MNCQLHPSRVAVNRCEKCGCGICDECASVTASTGNLCVRCAYKETIKDIGFDIELKKYCKRNFTLLLIAEILGALLVIIGGIILGVNSNAGALENDTAIIGLLILGLGVVIAGVPGAIDGWKQGSEMHKRMENVFGETYHVSDNGNVYKDQGFSTKLVYAFFNFFLGLAIIPGKVAKYYRTIKEIEDELEEIVPLKADLAKFYNNAVNKKSE